MKQKLYIFGIAITLLIFTGTIFKVNHWPAAGHMLAFGVGTLVLIFLPAALRSHYRAEGNSQNRILYIITWVTCLVVFTGMLFKVMHWPYAGIWMTIALPFPYVVFLPVFLIVTSKNKSFNIYNTVFILLLLALNSVFSTLLALNVSRDRINESFNLAQNYYRLEKVLGQLPVHDIQSPVNQKIDNVLKTADYYQEKMLNLDLYSLEKWHNDPSAVVRGDSPNIPLIATAKEGSSAYAIELENGMKELIDAMANTKGYETMAKSAPLVLDIYKPDGSGPDYGVRYIAFKTMAMSLIYLEGLKSDLLMLRSQPVPVK
jgi:hypothetical protein